jgi:hypothetical protein
MSRFFVATRYLFSIAATAARLGAGARSNQDAHAHWDRLSRQWVRRQPE